MLFKQKGTYEQKVLANYELMLGVGKVLCVMDLCLHLGTCCLSPVTRHSSKVEK